MSVLVAELQSLLAVADPKSRLAKDTCRVINAFEELSAVPALGSEKKAYTSILGGSPGHFETQTDIAEDFFDGWDCHKSPRVMFRLLGMQEHRGGWFLDSPHSTRQVLVYAPLLLGCPPLKLAAWLCTFPGLLGAAGERKGAAKDCIAMMEKFWRQQVDWECETWEFQLGKMAPQRGRVFMQNKNRVVRGLSEHTEQYVDIESIVSNQVARDFLDAQLKIRAIV